METGQFPVSGLSQARANSEIKIQGETVLQKHKVEKELRNTLNIDL